MMNEFEKLLKIDERNIYIYQTNIENFEEMIKILISYDNNFKY